MTKTASRWRPEFLAALARLGQGPGGYLLPEEARLFHAAARPPPPPRFSRLSSALEEYRERWLVIWEGGVLAICTTEKCAGEVKQALCPSFGRIEKSIARIEFADEAV